MTQSVGVVIDSQVGVVRCSLGGLQGSYLFGHLCTLPELQERTTAAEKQALLLERAKRKFAESIISAANQLQSA